VETSPSSSEQPASRASARRMSSATRRIATIFASTTAACRVQE
jgi:hypothetical protein